LAKIPGYVYIAAMAGVGLLGYFLYKKKEFPFNEGSIFSELKQDLSNLGPSAPSQRGGGQAPTGDLSGDMIPGTVQSNPSAVDYSLYQNYLQGLKQAFPDYVPNISSTSGQVIAGDPNLFQNNPINGPPVQPYPGGALMPPFTQQMYPYYRAPMIPEPGSMRGSPPPPPYGPPMMGPPRPPMGPPPWNDPWFEYDTDKFGRRRRKWTKPKPTASTDDECMIRVGSICIGKKGISMGSGGLNIGSGGSSGSSGGNTGGISVGGLMQGGSLGGLLGGMFGGGSSSGSGSGAQIVNGNVMLNGQPVNSGAIKGQVNSMLDDIFSKVGISR
jgi:hypothetical protein